MSGLGSPDDDQRGKKRMPGLESPDDKLRGKGSELADYHYYAYHGTYLPSSPDDNGYISPESPNSPNCGLRPLSYRKWLRQKHPCKVQPSPSQGEHPSPNIENLEKGGQE